MYTPKMEALGVSETCIDVGHTFRIFPEIVSKLAIESFSHLQY